MFPLVLSAAPAAGSISAVAGDVSTIVNEAVGWITKFIGVITSNPLILLFVIFGFIGTGIGLIKRLISM